MRLRTIILFQLIFLSSAAYSKKSLTSAVGRTCESLSDSAIKESFKSFQECKDAVAKAADACKSAAKKSPYDVIQNMFFMCGGIAGLEVPNALSICLDAEKAGNEACRKAFGKLKGK